MAFVISQSIVVGIMMLCYLAVPARIVGIEKPAATAATSSPPPSVGGAVGAVVCSPPYVLGRLGILMLGWHCLFWPGVILIVIGAALPDRRHERGQGGEVLGQVDREPPPTRCRCARRIGGGAATGGTGRHAARAPAA